MEEKIKDLNQRFDEMMEFLVEYMVTKEDSLGFATKEDLKSFATKDDLTQVRDDLMQEIRTVRNELDRLKQDFARLERRIGEDLDVYAEDIIDLKKRIKILEHQVREMHAV